MMFSCLLVLPAYAGFGDVAIGDDYNNIAKNSQAENTQDSGIISKILSKYEEKTKAWIPELKSIAFMLFGYFLVIDIILFAVAGGFSIANGGKQMGQVLGEFALLVILPASFMYTVITYYDTWAYDIIKWLQYTVAGAAEPASKIDEGNFFIAGLMLFDKMWDGVSIWTPSSFGLVIAGFIILICYSLMAMQIILIQAEAFIVMSAGIIILGFGGFEKTREYALNFIRYVLAVGIKLFVLQLMIGIAFSFVEDFVKTDNKMEDVSVIIGASIILLALIRCIPDICAGIIHGQHVGSGNALTGVVQNVTGAITAGASAIIAGGMAAGQAKSSVSALSQAANATGLTGGSKAAFMGKKMAGAAINTAFGDKANNSAMGRFNSNMRETAMSATPTAEPKSE